MTRLCCAAMVSVAALAGSSLAPPEPDPVAEVGAALDELHAAASAADANRYFPLFTSDAVFLGTDATERWPLDEFMAYATERFDRGAGWTYRLLHGKRFITIADDGQTAWFDELLENARYGLCRGTGVLVRDGAAWKIAQYHLTIPVPNEIALDVVRMIQSTEDGAAKPDQPRKSPVTSVYLVRHAHKRATSGDADPPLSQIGERHARLIAEMLRSVPITAVYATEFARTRQTAEPIAEAAGIADVRIISARDPRGLVNVIREDHRGGTVLVVGHSNTIPALLRELGVSEPVEIGEDDYDDLFLVNLDSSGAATMHRLFIPDDE